MHIFSSISSHPTDQTSQLAQAQRARVADAIAAHVHRHHHHTLSLAEADALMREFLATGQARFYHPGGEENLADPSARRTTPSPA